MFESVKQIIFAFCLLRNRGTDGTYSIASCELCVAAMIFSESGNVPSVPNFPISVPNFFPISPISNFSVPNFSLKSYFALAK